MTNTKIRESTVVNEQERKLQVCKSKDFMSTLTYDHVCDPTSMFQDSFSLSEFILGPQEEECIQTSLQMLQKDDIKEELDSEEEYPVSKLFQLKFLDFTGRKNSHTYHFACNHNNSCELTNCNALTSCWVDIVLAWA